MKSNVFNAVPTVPTVPTKKQRILARYRGFGAENRKATVSRANGEEGGTFTLNQPVRAEDDEHWIPWAQWFAEQSNRQWIQEGLTGRAGQLTADTVRHGAWKRFGGCP